MIAGRAEAESLASDVLVAGLSGPRLAGVEAARLLRLRPAGVIHFARNAAAREQVQELTASVDRLLPGALQLVDQEGGRVDRLRALFGRSPAPRELAARGEAAVAAEATRVAGALRVLGFNLNCAPVVDLDEGHERNGIGDRSLGGEPWRVAALAGRVQDAHARAGVVSCLKHFPGLGRTGEDTHFVRPTVAASLGELWQRDLVPFRLLLRSAPSVMVSHAAFPALTGDDAPASLSASVIEGLLRRDLAYEGLVLSDDMEMGAVTAVPPGERAVRALMAGCDLLLFCSDLDQAEAAHRALAEAAMSEEGAAARLRESAGRVRSLKRTLPSAIA